MKQTVDVSEVSSKSTIEQLKSTFWKTLAKSNKWRKEQ